MSFHRLFSMDVDVASFKVYALLCHDLSTLDSRGSTRGGWWNEGEIPGGGRRGSFCWLRAMMDGDDAIWDKSIGKVFVGNRAAIFEMYSEA